MWVGVGDGVGGGVGVVWVGVGDVVWVGGGGECLGYCGLGEVETV